MNSLIISIFGNQIFSEIMKELKFFSKYNIKFYDDLSLFTNSNKNNKELYVFFVNEKNQKEFKKLGEISFPLIAIFQNPNFENIFSGKHIERLNMPFKVFDLEKKIISLISKYEFKKSSIINLRSYIIDKNERKIKKDGLELQLTEKEIDFLILFSNNKKPLSRNLVLKEVWSYSSETDTHTLETHIHRLRKKILEKFNDNNFIKNNEKGYYI